MRRLYVSLALATVLPVLPVSAQIVELFIFGPVSPGLRGSNETPPNTSPATGGIAEFEGIGIIYDTTSRRLEYHYGWGSHPEVGGVDLEGDFTFTGIYDGGGNIIKEYTVSSFPGYSNAGNNGRTGFVDDSFLFSDIFAPAEFATREAELLAGTWFIRVGSTAHPTGEIRGQLTPIPEPQTWGMIAGALLMGFGVWRRVQNSQA